MRYVREPDAKSVALRVTTRIRSFTRVTLMLRWMGLGLGQPRVLSPINAVFFLAARLHPPCLTLLPDPLIRGGLRCLRDH